MAACSSLRAERRHPGRCCCRSRCCRRHCGCFGGATSLLKPITAHRESRKDGAKRKKITPCIIFNFCSNVKKTRPPGPARGGAQKISAARGLSLLRVTSARSRYRFMIKCQKTSFPQQGAQTARMSRWGGVVVSLCLRVAVLCPGLFHSLCLVVMNFDVPQPPTTVILDPLLQGCFFCGSRGAAKIADDGAWMQLGG